MCGSTGDYNKWQALTTINGKLVTRPEVSGLVIGYWLLVIGPKASGLVLLYELYKLDELSNLINY